jgi:RNA polymerase sigma factor (sigma-70 family)
MSGQTHGQDPPPALKPGPLGVAGTWRFALEQFHSGLFGFLVRRLRNMQNAEDLSQEVYLRLLRVDEPARVKNPQAYMYRVAVNAVQEFQAREENSPVGFDSELVARLSERTEDESATPERLFEQQTDEYGLQALIRSLPPMQRTVLLMAACQALPHAEIARTLGISVRTMRNHLYRALSSCRQSLQRSTSQTRSRT